MIQMQTNLDVADNSGARRVMTDNGIGADAAKMMRTSDSGH